MKYRMKLSYRIVQLLLFGFGFVLTLIRWLNVFNSDFVVISPEITSHILNFLLSLLAYLTIGSLWLVSGVKYRFIPWCIYDRSGLSRDPIYFINR